jgi:sarcosine oxidase subunit beta
MTDRSTADFVVIGAGVMGTSIAFHLARRNAGRIVVVDKGVVADGGSGRSSALIRMHYSYPLEVQLAVSSLHTFVNWEEILGRPAHFRRVGFARIVPEAEIDRLRAQVAMQQANGAVVDLVDRGQLHDLAPDWNVDDVPAAAWEPDSGYGDGAVVATDFLDAARDDGVEYRPHTAVTGLRVEGGRIVGVDTAAGPIDAPVVVAAVGPWTRPLLATAGVEVPIEPEYHEVAILQSPPTMQAHGPACIDSITCTYFRSDAGGLTLVGDFYGTRGVDPDDFPHNASDESLATLVGRAVDRVPALADAGIRRAVTGIYDVSPDARPILGQTEVAGLHLAAGFTGMGFKIAPAVGLTMSELLLDGSATTVDITPFRPSRFADGEPIVADHEYSDD